MKRIWVKANFNQCQWLGRFQLGCLKTRSNRCNWWCSKGTLILWCTSQEAASALLNKDLTRWWRRIFRLCPDIVWPCKMVWWCIQVLACSVRCMLKTKCSWQVVAWECTHLQWCILNNRSCREAQLASSITRTLRSLGIMVNSSTKACLTKLKKEATVLTVSNLEWAPKIFPSSFRLARIILLRITLCKRFPMRKWWRQSLTWSSLSPNNRSLTPLRAYRKTLSTIFPNLRTPEIRTPSSSRALNQTKTRKLISVQPSRDC